MQINRFALIPIVLLFLAGLASEASSAPELVFDRSSDTALFGQDATRLWHPASLTKIMTAYVALKAVADGRLTLDSPVVMSAQALKAPPSRLGLPLGTRLRLEDALVVLAVKSANDVAIAVAEAVSGDVEKFVEEMNALSINMGLQESFWRNPNGLHDPNQVTSARDMALLVDKLLDQYPDAIRIFSTSGFILNGQDTLSHNGLLGRYPGVNGFKTGYICSSGFNVVITAERDGRSLIAVVLGGKSARTRDARAAYLLEAGFSTPPSVIDLTMLTGDAQPVTDMRLSICGGENSSASMDEGDANWEKMLQDMPRVLSPSIQIHLLGDDDETEVGFSGNDAIHPRRF